jgi:hypothetical protein
MFCFKQVMIGASKNIWDFDPRTIPGCQLWLDAADSSTITFSSGSNVSVWTNKGIVSTTATPTIGATGNQVTYTTVNGYPGVYINNNGSALYNASTYSQLTIQSNFQDTADYSIFAVVNLSNVSSGPEYQTIYANARGASGETRTPNFGAGRSLEYNADSTNRSINGAFIGTGILQTALISSSSALTAYTNSTSYGSATNGHTRPSTDVGALPSIGGTFGSGNDNRFTTGYFHEILFYNSALTTSQRQQVEGYLAHKWGLTAYYVPSTPLSIPGCSLWLDASDSSTITRNGVNMTQWNDKSGTGNNMLPWTTFSNATVSSNFQNNLNVLNFSGAGVYQAPASSIIYPVDLYIVMALKDLTTHVDVVSMTASAVDNFNSLSFSEYTTSRWHNGSTGFGRTPNTLSTSNETSTSFLLINWSISNNNYVLRRNGTLMTQTASYTWTPTAASIFQIGFRVSPSLYSPASISGAFRGYIGEIVAFNTQLGDSQRQTIEGYLARKWGLTTVYPSLPITHRFYFTRPCLRAFRPIDVPGCQLWLDGADTTSLVLSGSSVTTWNDKSGNGYHMNTLTAKADWSGTAEYPTIGSPINGNQTINFTPQAGLRQSITLDGVKNLFWVGRIAAPTGTGGVHNSYFFLGHETHFDWHGLPYGQKFLDPAIATSGIQNASPTSLFTTDANAIADTSFLNVFKPTAPNVSLLSVSGITGSTRYQGLCFDRIYHFGWCGDLAEVLIYSTALSTADIKQVEGYLAYKWGLSGSLPATHPFKKLPSASVTPNRPDAIATVILTSLTTSSGTINWTSTNATGYTWYVGTGSGSGQVATGTITNGSTLIATVTYVFVVGTTYYAWVVPYNEDGLGPTTISAAVVFSGAFSPTSISGCQLWLDGNDPAGTGTQPANGATVSTWVDRSGNGRNATVAPSRVVGTYSTSFKAVNFATSSTGYITTYSAAPTNETMFVVFNNPSPSSANNIIIGGVSGARSLGAGYTNAGTGTVGNLNTQVVWLANTGSYTAGTTALVTSQFTTSTNTISLNGGTAVSGGAPGFTAGRVTYLGVDATNSFYHYVGYGMEILFYNSVLSINDRQKVEGYLAHKWGIQSSLPAGHPYKTAPP